jgi:hypothetical protein
MADVRVTLEELKEESDSGSLSAAPAPRKHLHQRLVWFGVLAALMVVGAAVWFVRSSAKVLEATLTALPLTTYSGFQGQPNFSPDGAQVTFTWNGEKRDNWNCAT